VIQGLIASSERSSTHPGINQAKPTLGRMHVSVVWCANYAMEIAYDLATHGVITSIVLCSSVSTIYTHFVFNSFRKILVTKLIEYFFYFYCAWSYMS
jgi:hypothetical protein